MNFYDKIYYSVYQHFQRSSFPWWSDIKTEWLIMILESTLMAEILLLTASKCTFIFEFVVELSMVLLISILGFNLWYFNIKKSRKLILKEGNSLNKKQKIILRISMNLLIIIVIVTIIILGIYIDGLDWDVIRQKNK